MSYVAPPAVTEEMVESGATKSRLSAWQLILRAATAVFLLGGATSLAMLAAEETGLDLIGALVFPMGLMIVILLGMELVTGNFALIPLAVIERRSTVLLMLRNFGWVILGHVIGGMICALLVTAVISRLWTTEGEPLPQSFISAAESQTLAYQELGALGGPSLALLSGILCNWLVALGVILAMTSKSTPGKIMALWPPIAAFYALDLEHSVVNLFVIPAGMMLGAPVGVDDWWLRNQLPVLLGNLIGGLLLAALPLYLAHRPSESNS